MAAAVGEQVGAHRGERGALQARLDRGHGHVAVGVDRLAVALHQARAHHLRGVGRLHLGAGRVQARRHGRGHGILVLGARDHAQRQHAPQHVIAPRARALGRGDGVVARRGLRQPRDHGHLRQRQALDVLAVVDARGGAHAVGALAEIDLVEIELEDAVLVELALDLERQEDLGQLAREGLLAAEEEVARHLHGDGAAALALLARAHQRHRRAQQALPVHARVLVEAVVLGGEEGLHQARRDPVELQRHAALLAELGDERAVARQHAQRHLQAHLAQRLDVRQARGDVDVGGGEGQHAGGQRGGAGGQQPAECAQGGSHHGSGRSAGGLATVTGLTAPGV